MPKYRNLTLDELSNLEKEFVDFLVVNGITADDWVRIKETNKEETDRIVELFSDVVFEGIMRKTRFLENRSKKALRAFQCLDDKLVLVALESTDERINLTDPSHLKDLSTSISSDLSIYTQEKEYGKPREQELFEMTEYGCTISDGKLFKQLSMLLAANA